MARQVAACLDEEKPLLCEAGTGTGKSLAYLVPAALYALEDTFRRCDRALMRAQRAIVTAA